MFSREEADRVARLCRLRLSEAEREEFAAQIDAILGFVEKLKELDVSGVEPTCHPVPLQNVMRPDEAGPSYCREEMLANAPDRLGDYFRVPKILEG